MQKLLVVALLCPVVCLGQGAHRINQVIVKGSNISANVAPYAQIRVCSVGTACNTAVTVYSDSALTHVLFQPVVADGSGNYNYYISPGCVDEKITLSGSSGIYNSNICPPAGTTGAGSVTNVSVATANGFSASVSTPTTTPVIAISTDLTHYLPTTADETAWNAKQNPIGFDPENIANKDQPNGYAGLDNSGLLQTTEFPPLTGDITSSSGSVGTTLATVNSFPGACGDATDICQITTNGKGLVTAQTPIALTAITNVSSGNLAPLFTSSITNPTTTPAIAFTLNNAPQNSVYAGPPSGGTGVPSFQTAPTFSAAYLTNFPLASTTVFGTFKPDGTTITCSAGVCSSGGGMVYPAAGIAVSTGTAWTTSISASSLVTLTGSQTITNKSLTSPILTGVPTAPTATPGTNTTQVATTAYVATPGAIAPTSVTVTGTGIPIATGSASNTDLAGFITLASGTGTFTFSATYVTAPVCIATDTTAANAVKASATTTVLTLTGTTTDVIAYVCVGRT